MHKMSNKDTFKKESKFTETKSHPYYETSDLVVGKLLLSAT